MDDKEILRCAAAVRDKFIHPAIERALKDRPTPMPPMILAQFFTALAVLSIAHKDKNMLEPFQRYKALSELALRKFLINRNLGGDGDPASGA